MLLNFSLISHPFIKNEEQIRTLCSFSIEILYNMCNYIRFCADRLLLSLGFGRHYKIGNPFEWMETISLQGKTNFFEKRVGEYSKSGVGIDRADQTFALDASF